MNAGLRDEENSLSRKGRKGAKSEGWGDASTAKMRAKSAKMLKKAKKTEKNDVKWQKTAKIPPKIPLKRKIQPRIKPMD